jgi:hypothetical protein
MKSKLIARIFINLLFVDSTSSLPVMCSNTGVVHVHADTLICKSPHVQYLHTESATHNYISPNPYVVKKVVPPEWAERLA